MLYENDSIRQKVDKFTKARSNLLFVVIFSAVNVILHAIDAPIYFPFSVSAPSIITLVCMYWTKVSNNSYFITLGIVFSYVIIFVFFLCWLLSKKHRSFVLISMILYSLDLLFLLYFIVIEFEPSLMLDLLFHAWVSYYLITGTTAWAKLKGVSNEEIEAALQPQPMMPVMETNQSIDNNTAMDVNLSIEADQAKGANDNVTGDSLD